MKRIGILLFTCFAIIEGYAQTVGISDATFTPNTQAVLDLTSDRRGFLPPRLELNGDDLPISGTKPAGLMVFNSGGAIGPDGLYYWTGSAWTQITTDANTIEGSGTLNYVPKFTPDGTAIGNSVIYDDGTNIGFGTTAPASKLHIVSGSDWNNITLSSSITNLANNGGIITGMRKDHSTLPFMALGTWDNGTDRIGYFGGGNWNRPDATRLNFYTAPTYTETNNTGQLRMTINPDGNVGINTTSTGTKLTVKAGSNSSTLTDYTQTITDKHGLLLTGSFGSGNYQPGVFWNTDNENPTKPKAGIFLNTTAAGSTMLFGTSTTYATGLTNTAMAIDDNGNVGMSSTTPGYKLDVYSASGIRIGDPANVYRSNLVFGQPNAWNSGIRVYDNGDAEMRIWHENANGQIVLATGYNGDQATAMPTDGLFIDQNKVGIGYASPGSSTGRLFVNGNVGIGTSTTAYNLDVLGGGLTARFDQNGSLAWTSGINIAGPGSSTYIFNEDATNGYTRFRNTNTGRYAFTNPSGTNNIMLDANGGTSYINSGNMALGSTSSSSKLFIDAGTTTALTINTDNSSPWGFIMRNLSATGGGLQIYQNNSGDVFFYNDFSGGGSWFNMGLNGNMGIGNSNLNAKLDVAGSLIAGGVTNGSVVFYRSSNPYTIGNTDAVLMVSDRSNSDWGVISDKTGYDYGMRVNVANSATYGFAVYNGSAWTSYLRGNGSAYFAGSVGIGTTSQSYELDVHSTGTSSLRLRGGATGYTNAGVILEATNSTHYRGLGVFMHDDGGNTEWYAGTPYAASDRYIIGRKSGVSAHDESTAQTTYAHFTVKNNGDIVAPRIYNNTSSLSTWVVVGTDGTLYRNASSIKYKDNVENYEPDMSFIRKLRPVTFIDNENTGTPGNRGWGLIAEELNQYYPEMVIKDDNGEIEGVKYPLLSVLLIRAIQEQQEEIDELKQENTEIKNLRKELEELKRKVESK